MKSILPWILVTGLAVAAAVLYFNGHKQEAELVQLRAGQQELQELRAKAEESKQTQSQSENEELVRLRKDNEDLLRLRNEVRQLRTQQQEANKRAQDAAAVAAQQQQSQQQMQQLLQENQQLRTQTQQVQQNNQISVCGNNLRMIDGAKQQWALQNQKPLNSMPSQQDLAPYFPNKTMPTCPAGGTYTINLVGAPPTCTLPGHVMPK